MAGSEDRIGVEIRITGKVQGVCFRAWTQEEANRRGVSGWVRNEPDGSVKALFVGSRERVESMLHRCRRGPTAAQVSDVETKTVRPAPDVTGFQVTG